jgi:hypothetical protein
MSTIIADKNSRSVSNIVPSVLLSLFRSCYDLFLNIEYLKVPIVKRIEGINDSIANNSGAARSSCYNFAFLRDME